MQTCNNTTLSGLKNSYAIHTALMNYYPVFGELLEMYTTKNETSPAIVKPSDMEKYLPPFFYHFLSNTFKFGIFIYVVKTGLKTPLIGVYKKYDDVKEKKVKFTPELFEYIMIINKNNKYQII